MAIIELKNVSKFYVSDRQKRKIGFKSRYDAAVDDISLTVEQGEFVFLVGSSGCGKSTLLSLLSGEVKPDRGKVYLDGKDLNSLIGKRRKKIDQTFGHVWQEPSLTRKMTVEENLRVAAMIRPHKNSTIMERVNKVLGLVGMHGTNQRFPAELNSGEIRRIELAKAMINSPPVLIIDEITNNLDDGSVWDIFQLLMEINNNNTTVIMTTRASRYVNIVHKRVVTMIDGKVFSDIKNGKYGDVG